MNAKGSDAGTIELLPLKSSLADVVVIGYGTVRRRDSTGAVVSVKGVEIRQVASGNAMQSLQGKLPGVDLYCPRGWAWAEDCRFITRMGDAAIWHDGSVNKDSKTVLMSCSFEGYDGFKLGRYRRDA